MRVIRNLPDCKTLRGEYGAICVGSIFFAEKIPIYQLAYSAARAGLARGRGHRPRSESHPHAREHGLPRAGVPGDEGIDPGTGDAGGHRL